MNMADKNLLTSIGRKDKRVKNMWYSVEVMYYYNEKLETDYGVVFGESYSSAMEKVLADYGEESIEKVILKWIDDSQVLKIPGEQALRDIEGD